MFTFDRKPRASVMQAPARKPSSQHQVKAPPEKTLESRWAEASPSVASGLQFDFARISIMPPPVQRKPTISSPGDRYEREADDVADKVMRMESAPIGSAPVAIQRKCAACEDEEKKTIQTKRAPSANEEAALDAGAAVRATERGGEPLPNAVRDFFEPRFGHDFSRVRVHANGEAVQAAQVVQARAYTVGQNIVFGRGEYAPNTTAGRRLIAHELTHVVQQAGSGATPYQTHAAGHDPSYSGEGTPVVQQKATHPVLQRESADDDAKSCKPLYLHKLCVRELGGCAGTRDAGLPSTEEMATYNASCRDESGYTGPDVALSDQECTALQSPTCERGAPASAREARVSKALRLSVKHMPAGIGEELVKLVSDPVFIGSLAVAVGVYLALWLAPEPVFTKIAAAATTLAILGTGYFSVSTLINLARAWGELESEAGAAQSDAELEQAAEKFGKRMGALEADLLVFLASLLVGGKLPGPKRVPAPPGQALGQAESALAAAGEGTVLSQGPGFSAQVIPFRPRTANAPGGGTTAAASGAFEGNLALKIQPRPTPQLAEVIPFPQPKPAPQPVPVPAEVPAPGTRAMPLVPIVPGPDSKPVTATAGPKRQTQLNPATNQPYASQEEYDRVPRYTNQTCKNSRLDELQEEKDLLTQSVPLLDPKSPGSWNPKKMAKVPCSRIRQRLEAQQKLLEKRLQIQKECFGGNPDRSHQDAIDQVKKGIANTKALEDVNCAPGHPMAGL